MDRETLLERVATSLVKLELAHPLRVCIDGPDGAGKTFFADKLADQIRSSGRAVIRASIDGFHRPQAERFARFGESPEGYYRDSFDYLALRGCLLDPLAATGNLLYRTATFDFRSDAPVEESWQRADPQAVLVFDGVFLLRRELRDVWDFRIHLTAGWDEVVRRVIERDSSWMGSDDVVRERYLHRYNPGQELYLQEASPADAADVVIDNTVLEQPQVVRGSLV